MAVAEWMRARATGGKLLILWSILIIGVANVPAPASASWKSDAQLAPYNIDNNLVRRQTITTMRRRYHFGRRPRSVSISCVPFARRISGIAVTGNAWRWWENAAGLYARGNLPELGSVLVFESNRHMRLGHVAVVSRVVSPREIAVDQANWPHGNIARGVSVVDVSERNDWTAVRVVIGRSGTYGSIYPTYGFIYHRPDNGRQVSAIGTPSPLPVLNPAPSDFRAFGPDEELAEAPAPYRHLGHAMRRQAMSRVRAATIAPRSAARA